MNTTKSSRDLRKHIRKLKVSFRLCISTIGMICFDTEDSALLNDNLYHSLSRIRPRRHLGSFGHFYALPYANTVRGQSLIALTATLA